MGIVEIDRKNMNIYFNIKKKLNEFTLDVSYGFDNGTLVIQGASGSGKTTILNVIAGLLMPDSAKVSIDGKVLYDSEEKINIPTRNRRLSYMFQNYALFPNYTVEKNILYGIKNLPEYKDNSKRVELVNYGKEIMNKLGISHLADKSPKAISGGEKQRVALARAIVTKPKLLLLDEPFSALDEGIKQKVYEEFLSFKKEFNIRTILITHSSYEAELLGDKLIHINEGQIID